MPKKNTKPTTTTDPELPLPARIRLQAKAVLSKYDQLSRTRQPLVMAIVRGVGLPHPSTWAERVLDEKNPLKKPKSKKDATLVDCTVLEAVKYYWRPYCDVLDDLTKVLDALSQTGRRWEIVRNFWFELLVPAVSRPANVGYYPELLGQAVGDTPADASAAIKSVWDNSIKKQNPQPVMPGLGYVDDLVDGRWQDYYERRWARESMSHYMHDFGAGWDPLTGKVVERDDNGQPILSGWSKQVHDDVTALLDSYPAGGEAYAVFQTHDVTTAKDDPTEILVAPPHVHVLLKLKQVTSLYTLLTRSGRDDIIGGWWSWLGYLQQLRNNEWHFWNRVDKLTLSILGTCATISQPVSWRSRMAYLTHYQIPRKGKGRPRPLVDLDPDQGGNPAKTTYSTHDVFSWGSDKSYSELTGIYDDFSFKIGHADILALVNGPLGQAHDLPKHVKRTRAERWCWYTVKMLADLRQAWDQDGDAGVLTLYAQWLADGSVQPGDWDDLLVGSLSPDDYTKVVTAYNGGNGLTRRLRRLDDRYRTAQSRSTQARHLDVHYLSSAAGGSGKTLIADLMGLASHGWRPGYRPEANTKAATGLTYDQWGGYGGERYAVLNEVAGHSTTYEGLKTELDPWSNGHRIVSSRNQSADLGRLETLYLTQTDDPLFYMADVLTKTKGSLARGYMDPTTLRVVKAWPYYQHWSQLARRLPSAITILVHDNKTTITVSRLSCRPEALTEADVVDLDWLDSHCYYVHTADSVRTWDCVLGQVTDPQAREDKALEMALWVNKTLRTLAEAWDAYWTSNPDRRWIDADDPDWDRTVMLTTCTGRPYTPQPTGGNGPDPDEWSDYHSAPVRAMKHEIETITHRLHGLAKQSLPDDTWLGGLPTANILDAPGLHYDPALTAGLRVNSADVIGMSVYHGLATIRDGGGTAVMIGNTPALCCELEPSDTAMSPYNRLYLWHGGVDSNGNDRVMWLACQYVTIPAGLSAPMTTAIYGVVEDNWGNPNSYVDGGRPRVYMVDPRRR